jgi:peptide deformylase
VWQQPTKARPGLIDTGPKVLVNPKLVKHSSATQFGYEGCGSLPGIMAKVRRYKSVQMEYMNHITGKKEIVDLKDFEARIAQHEYEHLQGGSFLDTADIKTVIAVEEFRRLDKEARRKNKAKK